MTHDEIVTMGKKCRLQRSYYAMHEAMKNLILPPETIRYMAVCGTMPVDQTAAHQKVLAFADSLIRSNLNSVEVGMAQYRAERGKQAADMFLRHYKFGEQIAAISEHYNLSPSTIKRRLGLVETGRRRSDQTGFRTIPLGWLKPNPLNKRSMSGIRTLAQTIQTAGLLVPLTVYQVDEDEFVLISGHRRLAALKSIEGVGNDLLVPCYVIKKPDSKEKEEAMLAAANIGRKDPKSVRAEIQRAGKTWDDICRYDRMRERELTKSMKADFMYVNRANPAFLKDPVGYTRRTFRPKVAYIQMSTGLPIGATTIKSCLSDEHPYLPKTSDYATEKEMLKCVKKLSRQLETAEIDSSRQMEANHLLELCQKVLSEHSTEVKHGRC